MAFGSAQHALNLLILLWPVWLLLLAIVVEVVRFLRGRCHFKPGS